MKNTFLLIAMLTATGLAGATDNADRVEHFEGLPAPTMDDAVKNFAEYNAKLRHILEQKQIIGADLANVHELTYTLENALAKITAELTELAETLEAVHLASESGDIETVKSKGAEYLSVAETVAPNSHETVVP